MLILPIAIAGSDDVANYDRPEETRQRAHPRRYLEKSGGGLSGWPIQLPTVSHTVPRSLRLWVETELGWLWYNSRHRRRHEHGHDLLFFGEPPLLTLPAPTRNSDGDRRSRSRVLLGIPPSNGASMRSLSRAVSRIFSDPIPFRFDCRTYL